MIAENLAYPAVSAIKAVYSPFTGSRFKFGFPRFIHSTRCGVFFQTICKQKVKETRSGRLKCIIDQAKI